MEPTERQLHIALEALGPIPDNPIANLLQLQHAKRVAQALADEFARGAASALDNLELHQITDAACKRATADGLEITIRVKQLANPKKSKRKGKR